MYVCACVCGVCVGGFWFVCGVCVCACVCPLGGAGIRGGGAFSMLFLCPLRRGHAAGHFPRSQPPHSAPGTPTAPRCAGASLLPGAPPPQAEVVVRSGEWENGALCRASLTLGHCRPTPEGGWKGISDSTDLGLTAGWMGQKLLYVIFFYSFQVHPLVCALVSGQPRAGATWPRVPDFPHLCLGFPTCTVRVVMARPPLP